MIINDLDGYYIVFVTKNWNIELDTLLAFCGEQNQDNVVFLPYGFLTRARISFFSLKCQSIISGASACISP